MSPCSGPLNITQSVEAPVLVLTDPPSLVDMLIEANPGSEINYCFKLIN